MKSLVQSRLLIIGLAVAVSNIAVANAQCYYPGGTWAKDQFPCNGHAYTTLCCPTGWTCFSNNLCIATDPSVVSSDLPLGTSIRGTCTNPLWNSTACGDFCLNNPVSSNNGSVIPCGGNKYCCQPDSADGICDCGTGKGTFQIPDGTAQTIISVVGLQHTSTAISGSAAQTSSAAATPSLSATVSAISSSYSATMSHPDSSSSLRSSGSSTSSATKSASSTILASSTSTGSASTATSALDTSTPITHTTAFKAGVGATASVAGAVIAVFVLWFLTRWWRRHGRNSKASRGRKWVQNPMTSDILFQVPPNPHPYGGSQFSASQSRGALADQTGHNRRTLGPIDLPDEQNPYSDRYMTAGR